MATLQSPLGVVKERPACCRVMCFGGLWVFSWVFGFFLMSGWALLWVILGFLSWVLFPFSVSCCGLVFSVSCVYFLCTKSRLYAFLINLFLPIKKRKEKKRKRLRREGEAKLKEE
jgi:hypothetical protein